MMEQFTEALPKVELHAHLNGSLSEETIQRLISLDTKNTFTSAETVIAKGTKRTLKDCFDMFKIIQRLTADAESIKYATKAVINDFAADHVCYLELRSTPRGNSATGLTKRSYVEAVLEGIEECTKEHSDAIEVRFLLSIDRRLGIEEAEDTVNLAIEYKKSSKGRVVGLDFSGDPNARDGREYLEILKKAKQSGLRLALHMAEIRGLQRENIDLLSIPPDRIGHGTFLHEELPCEDIVRKRQIPLEICLTSNVKGGTVESFAEEHHHMHRWKNIGQPFVLCTDDKGVFSTTLSNEYRIAAAESGMTRQELFDLSKRCIDFIFASDDVKTRLRLKLDTWKEQHSSWFL